MPMRERRPRDRRERVNHALPDDLIEWFAGKTTTVPWSALLPPDYGNLAKNWRRFRKEHPGAQRPPGLDQLLGVDHARA